MKCSDMNSIGNLFFPPPSTTGENFMTPNFITSSTLLRMSTLIQIPLPHSLTSSQGQSEGQFPVKSPALPLASPLVWTLGSWPLSPPPGLCWYGCDYERLLGRTGVSQEVVLFSECNIQRSLNNNILLCLSTSLFDYGHTIKNWHAIFEAKGKPNNSCKNKQPNNLWCHTNALPAL